MTFSEKPTPDVKEIQSDSWYFADSGSTYLKFKGSKATFNRIRSNKLEKVDSEKFNDIMLRVFNNIPEWWAPILSDDMDFYSHEAYMGEGDSFANEATVMSFNKNTGMVYYAFSGID